MVLSLVNLCAREVVRDHSLSHSWLRWVPRELFKPLLEAAFTSRRPLAVGELVQRWPERTLRVGGPRKGGQSAPNRLCTQALLLAVVKGLATPGFALQLLDLCGMQGDEGVMEDTLGRLSLTVALCTVVMKARADWRKAQKREGGERERKRFSALERKKDLKRERAKWRDEPSGDQASAERREPRGEDGGSVGLHLLQSEEELVQGVLGRMEIERRSETSNAVVEGSRKETADVNCDVLLHVRADLFVNARSWECARVALSTQGPLKLQCRFLRIEEISVSSIRTLLDLLPNQGLLGIDVRYSKLGVAGLTELLPRLSAFPALNSLCLHYCSLILGGNRDDEEEALRTLSLGLAKLQGLKHLSLTALRLPGKLCALLSSLPRPLEILELPYVCLSPADLAYLSCSHHAASLQQLDLSENPLDAATLPSVRRLLSQASGRLQHLSLSGCGLSDSLLGLLLPSLQGCRALKSLALALNPLSMNSLLVLVRVAVRMPSLRHLLYPNPLEDYQPGLPDAPSSAQLLDWPLDESFQRGVTSSQLKQVLKENGRSDIFLTCDLLNYDKDLVY